jgi:hypothetical protein
MVTSVILRSSTRLLGAIVLAAGWVVVVFGYSYYRWTWWNVAVEALINATGIALLLLKPLIARLGALLLLTLIVYGHVSYHVANWGNLGVDVILRDYADSPKILIASFSDVWILAMVVVYLFLPVVKRACRGAQGKAC